jgi:hypothetical protein
MTRASHSSWFSHPNNITWSVQIMKHLNMINILQSRVTLPRLSTHIILINSSQTKHLKYIGNLSNVVYQYYQNDMKLYFVLIAISFLPWKSTVTHTDLYFYVRLDMLQTVYRCSIWNISKYVWLQQGHLSSTLLVNVILLLFVLFHACDIKIVAIFCLNIRISIGISIPFPFHISNNVNVLQFPVGYILATISGNWGHLLYCRPAWTWLKCNWIPKVILCSNKHTI